MSDTEKFITQLESGPLPALLDTLDDQPRRMNTFLSQPATHGEEQWMPMHFAARAGHTPALSALLERGVHPDCRTRYRTPMHARQTPLHLAAAGGHDESILRLLEAAAEVEVRDALGRSPLWMAARYQHAPVVSQLLRRGADPEAKDAQGRTPLHAALIAEPPENPPAGERTSVHGSDQTRTQTQFNPAAALALLDGRADPNAVCPKDPDGYTPLHRCVVLGESAAPVIERLLEAGADRAVADPRYDRTAVQLAEQLDRPAMANWLREK